ncbi:hypothetical protein SV7mr_28160 [Stieleria bergensis]|uniref:Nucleoid-associated protein YbaB n=1 Tax=Stieleria bergensis TaxID=2528025 RepID=A0A517SVZ4_9BACT|nr:hypothetical protein SV7mr_28160 [Planctomycetes bacterium SV_7m_r]
MFKGLGNLGNIAALMASFKELPGKMEELNLRMKETFVTGSSGCGHVSVTCNCTGQVQKTEITVEGIPNAKLQQAITDAANEAGKKAKAEYASAIKAMATEMNLDIPGIDGFLTTMTGH